MEQILPLTGQWHRAKERPYSIPMTGSDDPEEI